MECHRFMALFPICLLCFSSLFRRVSHPARLLDCSPASFPVCFPSAGVRIFYSFSNQLLIKNAKKIEISGGFRIFNSCSINFLLKAHRKSQFLERFRIFLFIFLSELQFKRMWKPACFPVKATKGSSNHSGNGEESMSRVSSHACIGSYTAYDPWQTGWFHNAYNLYHATWPMLWTSTFFFLVIVLWVYLLIFNPEAEQKTA